MGWLIAAVVVALITVMTISRMTVRMRVNAKQGMIDGKVSLSWLDGLVHLPIYFSIYADGPQWGIDVRYKKKVKRIPFAIASKKTKKQYLKDHPKKASRKKALKKFFTHFLTSMRDYIQVRLLSLRAQIGVQDAAYTALLCGGINAIVLGLCASMNVMDVLSLRILPHYSGSHFDATVGCIVYLRPWHIILALFKAGLTTVARHHPIRKAGKAGYHGASN